MLSALSSSVNKCVQFDYVMCICYVVQLVETRFVNLKL